MFKVQNFKYNGFASIKLQGIASYTAKFIKWTQDPGIARCECSDGKIRLIPSCDLLGNVSALPKQTYENGKLFIGPPSCS